MPDKINIAGLSNFLKSDADISGTASKFSSNSTFAHNNDYVVNDYVKNTYADEIKKAKDTRDAAYATTGHSEEEAQSNTDKGNFWTDLFNTAKLSVVTANPGLAGAMSMTLNKSVEQVKEEVTNAFYQNKAFDRALKNGIVKTNYGDGQEDVHSLQEDKNYMDNADFLDNLKYAIGIEEDKMGGKKLSISNGSLTDWFYYLDKDKDGKDILSRAPIKDKKKFQELGKTVLNAYGAVPLFKGGLREFAAQVSNTYSSLAENLVNVNRAATNLVADALPETKFMRDYADKVTNYSKQFTANMEIQQSQAGVGGIKETLASGTGQGLSSMGQMAILGAATGMLGEFIAPAASAAGKLEAITNFGAGSILNFNEAYKSALDAGLSESKAASIGALTGAINGMIESSIGSNRLFNWMSGGGDRALARHVLEEIGTDVSGGAINKAFNKISKGLTGNAAEYINKIMEMPVVGTALEEATEEFLQTYSQKSVENLYDVFVAGDKAKGKGKFGTDVWSKDTFSEAIESAMYGAILGGGGDITKVASEKLFGKNQHSEIIPLIAQGKRAEVDAVVKAMHASKVITDQQKDIYTKNLDHLESMYTANTGVFSQLDGLPDQDKANKVKGEALTMMNKAFELGKTNEELKKRMDKVANDPSINANEKKLRLNDIQRDIQKNSMTADYLNNELDNEYKPDSTGKIAAYENNFINRQEILENKVSRFNYANDIKRSQSQVDTANAELVEVNNKLANPDPDDHITPKEYADKKAKIEDKIKDAQSYVDHFKSQLQAKQDEYNHITSKEYQAKIGSNSTPSPVQAAPVVTPTVTPTATVTTPVVSVPEVAVQNNSNTVDDIQNAPVVQKQQLEDEFKQLSAELETNDDLDPATVQSMSDRLNDISQQLTAIDKQGQVDDSEYKAFTKEVSLRAVAGGKLDANSQESLMSTIKKDIEQVLPGFKSKGIDTEQLEKLHAQLTGALLNIRDKRIAAEEEAKRVEEASKVKAEPVTTTSFFSKLQRLPFMNTADDYWTDEDVSKIFAENSVAHITELISFESVNPTEVGYTAGQKLGGTMGAVVPKTIIRIKYGNATLGHMNMIDGFESTDPGFFNLDQEGYNNVIDQQTKLLALIKADGIGMVGPDTLKAIGFNMQWNGQFDVDNSVPRTLIQDYAPAQLEENGGKPYMYDTVNQLEITEGTQNMRDYPGVPAIPAGLEERYLVLVKAKNGKFYWATAQNQIIDTEKQNKIYKALFLAVEDIKKLTTEEEVKDKVSTINKWLNDNVFVTVPYASLSLTTPNKTNKNYTLQLKVKGQKSKRVVLDHAKFGNMSDLVNELGLKSSQLRTTLADNAPASATVGKLSVNLTPNVVTNNNLHNSITFSMNTGKINDVLVGTTVREAPMDNQSIPTPSDVYVDDSYSQLYDEQVAAADAFQNNPFAGYVANAEDNPEIVQDPEITALEVVPDGTEEELVDPPILDLSRFHDGYNDLAEADKARISAQADDLLKGYDELNKLKKKGVDNKIKDLISSYVPSTGDPVFSIGTSEETMDIPEAQAWIESKLPESVKVEDINNLLGNIKNNGITYGAFANNVIYLASNAEKGTQYHEAFHAVFRMFLTNPQIKVALNIAKGKYGVPTKADLNALKNSSSVYFGYNDSRLADLWLEEKMANEFKDYLNDKIAKSKLAKIWNKISDFIKFVTGNMDQLESLFYNINRGKFKNATVQSNVFSYGNQDSVFSIFKRGVDQNGHTITTTQQEGAAIVAILTNKYLNAIKGGEKNRKALLDRLIAEQAKFYSIDDNPFYAEYLDRIGKADDDAAIEKLSVDLELKRAVFVLPENIAALKKDIENKSRLFDIEEADEEDNRAAERDEIGERHDVAVWTIGGETSFSKVLKEYISLVTIPTTDKYGQVTEDAVDFKKIYRGLIRGLAGVEEDNVLPRFKALAEFDADIKAVFDRLTNDLGLTLDGPLNTQDITKNHDLWRKFVTAFNNEKVGWYTVLHSPEQSRLIESNNATAKDLQFNDWFRDYSVTFQLLGFDPVEKKKVYDALDAINRSNNIKVTSFAQAKEQSKEIRNNFLKVNVRLSNAYIAYSLLKNSDYNALDDAGKAYIDSFAGNEGLFDSGNIPFIVSEFKSGSNPFETTIDTKGKERGAVTRLKTIADQNSLFDPTVGESSFQNADGKNVYSIIRPSFGLVKLRWLRDSKTRQRLLSEEATKKDNFISPNGQVLNHLLSDPNVDLIFQNLTPSMIDGYRETRIEGDTQWTEEGEGATFGKFDAKQYLLTDFLMFLSNRKSLNKIDPTTGKVEKVGESAMFNINQMEASSTGYGVFLPVNDFGTINDKATNILFNYFMQEVERIKKVKAEFGQPGTKVWLGYNDTKDGRGFKLTEFADYGLESLLEDENIDKAKALELIKAKLGRDIAAYKEVLKSNGILDNLPVVELEKRGYKVSGKKEVATDRLITDFYLNGYINTLGINNLLLDNYAKKVKNSVDWFKRAKGIIGSGPDMGKGTTRVGVYEEPVKYINVANLEDIDIDKMMSNKQDELNDGVRSEEQIKQELKDFKKDLEGGKIMIADAQSYVTLNHKIAQLKTWGRYPKQVEDIYNKIASGQAVTWAEKNVLEDNNAALNSTKTVSYNGDYYFKLSELILAPSLVGEVGEDGNVIMNPDGTVARAKKGYEYLFNKYNAMISQQVDQVLPLSASKMATVAPAKFAKDGKFDFTGHTMDIENKFKRLQVETPSGKTHIVHGTQLIQLVHSEQDDNMKIDFEYNKDIKTVGDLRNYYRQLLADNRLAGFKQALAYVKDPLSGEFNSKDLTSKFYQTIVESGSDEVMSNFFTPGANGERQFNWNLGPVLNKAEQLFLAHFSKGVLSQKVSGLKVSLVSDTGIQIEDRETGEMRSLKHMVKDIDGNYYSECLLPPFAEELLGENPSDSKVKEVLKMFGIRIPTQDKHSMMSLKVVGFLPVEYGSVGVFAKEIVYLSGADFDIDSEYIHRPDFYVAKDGTLTPYGTAKDDAGKFEEYKEWNKVNNKLLKKKLQTYKTVEEAMRVIGLPSTLEEFIKEQPTNVGTNDNAMLKAQIMFLTNDYVRNRAALIPSSMDSIKAVAKTVNGALNRNKAEAVSPNTPLARFNANRNNMEGSAGIGPVALANVSHSLLSTSDVELIGGIPMPTLMGHTGRGFKGIYTIGSTSDRKNDNISTLLSAMTDNAKEQLARALNLSFNSLPTDTLPSASYMLSNGYTMEETILFLNLPSIRAYSTSDAKLEEQIETGRERFYAHLDKIMKDLDVKDKQAFTEDYILRHTPDLEREKLISLLTYDPIESDVHDYLALAKASRDFTGIRNQASYSQSISSLMSLNKGMASTFEDNLKTDGALERLQLRKLLHGFITPDVTSTKDLLDKMVAEKVLDERLGKYYAGEKFPAFKMNRNPSMTPFDARLAIINDPNTLQNIIIHKQVTEASKQFFLANTPVFTELKDMTRFAVKDLIPHFMDRAYRNYMKQLYPDKFEEFGKAANEAGYMIHKSGINSVGRDLYNLQKDPKFKNNLLINLLTLKNPVKGSNIVSIEFPTRIKAEGDFYTNLNNAFKELFMNPATNLFARKLYYYSYFKNGLQFKNKSFINTIPAWVFKDVSGALDVLNDDFKEANFDEYSSLEKTVEATLADMFTAFSRVSNLAAKLNPLPNQKAYDKIIKTTADSKAGTSTLSFLNKGIDTSSLDAFQSDIDNLADMTDAGMQYGTLFEENLGGIKYEPAAFFKNKTTDSQNPGQSDSSVVGMRIKSIKAFNKDGDPVEMELKDVLRHKLDTGFLPTAYEVIYDRVTTIVEPGITSTVVDNSFLDKFQEIVKTVKGNEPKVTTVENPQVEPDYLPGPDDEVVAPNQPVTPTPKPSPEQIKAPVGSSVATNGEQRKFTPDKIVSSKDIDGDFVFGSNTQGRHGLGAALVAKNEFGAKYGQAEGHSGRSFAIVTKDLTKPKDQQSRSVSLQAIGRGIQNALKFYAANPNKKAYFTELGSALAGYSKDEIKGLFSTIYNAKPELFGDNVILPRAYEVRPLTTSPFTDEPTIETDPVKVDNLELSDNNSTFVNPFGMMTGNETIEDLGLDDSDFAEFQNANIDADVVDQLGEMTDDMDFEDDSELPIC